MKFQITIDLDGDAFSPDPVHEIVRILNREILMLESSGISNVRLHDINGNHCGDISFIEDGGYSGG